MIDYHVYYQTVFSTLNSEEPKTISQSVKGNRK